ncbi:MAG: TIGR03862 family flavoprotein [Burkholderiaceae bacterium]|nr:TIGR03862 family flavoprotein [Burkholderiaceae bacterium]
MRKTVVVIGGGPAGLMAAQALAQAGASTHVYDAMPTVGRKLLLAGKGGLNLTHSEPLDIFVTRYGERRAAIEPLLRDFPPQALRDWAQSLGTDTFIGTSGRVFPTDMKAAPLLRAWLHRLRAAGVQFHMRHRWLGWDDAGALRFAHRDAAGAAPVAEAGADEVLVRVDASADEVLVQADAVVLALGGASWPRLGSDGAWQALLRARGVPVTALSPSNSGFDVAGWTPHFSSRFAGLPFKTVAVRFTDSRGRSFSRKGEFVATATGVEGSLIYALSALLRDEIARQGSATFELDLLPDRTPQQVLAEVSHPRGARSLGSHLKSRLGLDGIKAAILHELLSREQMHEPPTLAAAIKALPIRVTAVRPIEEAISSAGGVPFEAMDADLMLRDAPGVFCAGEMLDWEAPTGGYLLNACLASGLRAGQGAARWLAAAT